MAPHITASPAEGVTTADMPTPTAKEIEKRQNTSTSIAKHAMSTPYVFPSTCTLSYAMTSKSSWLASDGGFGRFGIMSEQFLYISAIDNTLWQTCQPTGAMDGYAADKWAKVYRGAVCPKGWVAHEVGLASQNWSVTYAKVQTWSSAKCCKRYVTLANFETGINLRSGDALGDNIWSINSFGWADWIHSAKICISTSSERFQLSTPPSGAVFASYTVRYYTTETTFSPYTMQYITIDENSSTSIMSRKTVTDGYDEHYVTTLAPFVAGRAFYPPMSLEWLEEDNTTLYPKWPTLTSDMLLPTWPIGADEKSAFTKGAYENRGQGRREVKVEATMPNKVAIPIISVLAVLLLAALAGIAFLLWKAKGGRRPTLKAKNSELEIPLPDEAGSTAHLAGTPRTDDMELRER